MNKPLTPANAWLKKWYPTPAKTATKTELQAAKHSLRKWTGLLPKNRKDLQLENNDMLLDGDDIVIELNDDCCALCQRHIKQCYICCENCILFKVSNNISCCEKGSFYRNVVEALTVYSCNESIRHMVKALSKCVRVLQRKSKKL